MNGLINDDGTPKTQVTVSQTEQAEQPDSSPLNATSTESTEGIEFSSPGIEDRQESYQEKNFREVRQQAWRAQQERDKALQLVREYESKLNQQQNNADDFEEISLGAEDIAEGKHLNKVQKQLKAMHIQQKKLMQEQKQRESDLTQKVAEAQLRSEYPDLYSVVSQENLSALSNDYPELSQSLLTNPDYYQKAKGAYTLIKKLGIHKDAKSYEAEKARVARNAAKPGSLSSVSPQQSNSPLANANAFADGPLNDDMKKQLFKEMMDARKGY